MNNTEVLKRLYRDYTRKFLNRILLALIFSLILAGSTSSIAYLLDPAIEKIFLNKDRTLIYIIPFFIILLQVRQYVYLKSLDLDTFH